MVRIDRGKGVGRFDPPDRGRRVEGTGGPGFGSQLRGQREAGHRRQMEELLAAIDREREKLGVRITVQDLMYYRQLVREFLAEATERAYLLQQERSWTRQGAQSLLVSVQRVDQEVEELLQRVARQAGPPEEVLERLDKVRGMLVDLMA
ncbi:MAG: YaaR family protein [Syntrophomonadaceae bacterium]|nr:YaaR family protein [Syntrophomonadaceae bacterium]MDH7498257.1 YaaR family protein [Syntrophomonadaceae bacterium]